MRLEFVFRDDQEIADTIESLRAFHHDTLAGRIYQQAEHEREVEANARAWQAERDAQRAERARNHTLTVRQAQVLAALRAGKSASETPYSWTNGGVVSWSWRRGRSMGGAIRRMIETMQGDGLIYPYRHESGKGGEATPAGLERLAAWEAKHGRVGP